MEIDRVTAAIEWQREVLDMQREAHDDVVNAAQELLGEHGALVVIVSDFLKYAPLAVCERVLRPMQQDMRALKLPEEDLYRVAFRCTIEHFCERLPPDLPL